MSTEKSVNVLLKFFRFNGLPAHIPPVIPHEFTVIFVYLYQFLFGPLHVRISEENDFEIS